MVKKYVEYGRTDEYRSKFDAGLESSVLEGLRLFEDEHAVGLGNGMFLDLLSFLRQSSQARAALKKLTPQERFTLEGHLILRKSQKILAELVGLNECRFAAFLTLTLERFAALTAISYLSQEDLSDRFRELDCAVMSVCYAKAGVIDRSAKKRTMVQVPTHEILQLLERGLSWFRLGELYQCHYVSLRQEFEKTIEKLQDMPGLLPHVLSILMLSKVKFGGVQDGVLSGKMKQVAGTRTTHQDPEVLGQLTINVTNKDFGALFTPRALNASSPE